MGLNKQGASGNLSESGAQSAIERLTSISKIIESSEKEDAKLKKHLENEKPIIIGASYKPRDFDAEARGKTRCALYGEALSSPAIAGLRFESLEELLVLVRKAADDGVKYTFGEK